MRYRWISLFLLLTLLGNAPLASLTPIPEPLPTPTPEPTATPITTSPTPTPTTTPISGTWAVVINEYLPAPQAGTAEFIELYNAGPDAADLRGWLLDDIADGGMAPKKVDAIIPAGGWWSLDVAGLNNDGDSVRLLDSNGVIIDSQSYTTTVRGFSHSRIPDGSSPWLIGTPATPNAPNAPLPQPTPTSTTTPISGTWAVVINEYLPAPQAGTAEFIELYNAGPDAADLRGWLLDDIADGGMAPKKVDAIIPAGGWWSLEVSGLNNDGDSVRLLDSNSVIIDSQSYTTTVRGFSHSRIPDGSSPWLIGTLATPNAPNAPLPQPTPTPTTTPISEPWAVVINEYLPAPQGGAAEFIELYNAGPDAADLHGWLLDDIADGGMAPKKVDVIIPAGGWWSLEVSGLNNDGDSVRLLNSNSVIIDSQSYTTTVVGLSHSRIPDGGVGWLEGTPPTPAAANAPPPPLPEGVVLNEIFPHPFKGGQEWVELYSLAVEPIDLSGWLLDDLPGGTPPYVIPDGTLLLPGAWIVLEVPTMFNDGGDQVRLLTPIGAVVDRFGYAKTRRLASWSRIPDGTGPWFANTLPTPYEANAFPEAEPAQPAGTTAATGAILFTEVLYDPTTAPDHTGEWFELVNPYSETIQLHGWKIRDAKTTTQLPALEIAPRAVIVIAPLDTPLAHDPTFTGTLVVVDDSRLGNSLGNSGDLIVLEDSAGTPIDALAWNHTTPIMAPPVTGGVAGTSLQRSDPWHDTDTAQDWTIGELPTPGILVTTTLPLTPTIPATEAAPGTVLITRVMYDPAAPLRDPAGEWLELTNISTTTISLHGWSLHDDRSRDLLPNWELPAGATILIAASESVTATFGITETALVLGQSIGNGLSNAGDHVALLDGAGTVIDAVGWGGDTAVFSPSVALIGAGSALQRRSLDDTDSAADWGEQLAARPLHAPPEPIIDLPPLENSPILLSEVLASPKSDWNHDGEADTHDEWIELVNRANRPIDLQGWLLDDIAAGGSTPFLITESLVLEPHGYLVFFRTQTGLSLNNDGDTIRLLEPTGRLADGFEYTASKPDTTWARIPSPTGNWSNGMHPTPKTTNIAPAPGADWEPSQPIASITTAQKTAVISGVVTIEPSVLRENVLYVEDQSGGMLVRLGGKKPWPNLVPGQHVLLRGKVGSYHGEIQLTISNPENLIIGNRQSSLPTLDLTTQTPDVQHVGRLVRVSGRYVRAAGRDIEIMTSDGDLVRLHPPTGMRKPKYRKGAIINAVGIVGSYDGKLRVQLRGLADLGVTGKLPVTATGTRLPRPWIWIIGLVVVGGWLRRKATTHLDPRSVEII